MKAVLVLLVLGLCGYGFANIVGTGRKVADGAFLEREKNILRLLMYVNQPNTFQDQVNIGRAWSIQSNINLYGNVDLVNNFLQEYTYSFLPRGTIFTIANPRHIQQAKALFSLFYYANDFDTFYKTACWARDYVNEGMFVYALSIAVIHRPDCQGMILPAPYEIYPHYFVNSDVIQKAYRFRMQNYYNVRNANNMVVIPANYSGWYIHQGWQQQPTYFLEDVGLNSWYYYYNLDYPAWMNGTETGINRDRRGELYYFIHQQILARYYLERLSNGLGEIPLSPLEYVEELSYTPSLMYPNGVYFPFRPSQINLIFDDFTRRIAEEIHNIEDRLRNAIDSGYVFLLNGEKLPILNEKGINILGNLIQGNPDSVQQTLYGYLPLYLRKLLSYNGKALHLNKLQPGVLEHYETSLRDPAFYSIYKKVVELFQRLKVRLGPYTREELFYSGVTIENMDIDKLVTYFDTYDFDLNNALYTEWGKELDIDNQVLVKARQQRLNHKPFTYRINLKADQPGESVVQIYLGPKFDVHGNEIPIEENRLNMFLIDRFVYDLKVGKNVIERNSRQSRLSVKDRTSYYTLYQKLMFGIQGTEDFILDNSEAHCGFPNRLILPRGTRGGMVYQIYVVISPLRKPVKATYETGYTCGIGSGSRYLDYLPFGYPFDRPIQGWMFQKGFIPNIYAQDVVIYHKSEEEINSSVQI